MGNVRKTGQRSPPKADPPLAERVKGRRWKLVIPLCLIGFALSSSAVQAVELTYVSDGDANGVFYYRGTNDNTQAWTNPHTAGRITISKLSTETWYECDTPINLPQKIVDRANGGQCPPNNYGGVQPPGSWIMFDIGAGYSLIPNKYSWKDDDNAATYQSAWAFQGSNDTSTWTTIHSISGVTDWNGSGSTWRSYTVAGTTAYRYLRILNQTSGGSYLMMTEFEMYGTLTLPISVPLAPTANASGITTGGKFNFSVTSGDGNPATTKYAFLMQEYNHSTASWGTCYTIRYNAGSPTFVTRTCGGASGWIADDWQTLSTWNAATRTLTGLLGDNLYALYDYASNDNGSSFTVASPVKQVYSSANLALATTGINASGITTEGKVTLAVTSGDGNRTNSPATRYAFQLQEYNHSTAAWGTYYYVHWNAGSPIFNTTGWAADDWQSAASWSGKVLPGMLVDNQYAFWAYSLNADGYYPGASLTDYTYSSAKVALAPTADAGGNLSDGKFNFSVTSGDGNRTNSPATRYGFWILPWNHATDSWGSGLYIHYNAGSPIANTTVWNTGGYSGDLQDAATWGTKILAGLLANNLYNVYAYAYNADGYNPAASPAKTVYSAANIPVAPTVTNPTSSTTSVSVAIVEDNNPRNTTGLYPNDTRYLVFMSPAAPNGNNYVQSDGSLGASGTAYVASKSAWGTKAITGLKPNTGYNFRALAYNQQSYITNYGTISSWIYTYAVAPNAPILGSAATATFTVQVASDNNATDSQYALAVSGTPNHIQADGTLNTPTVWQTASVWGIKTVTGLTANTQYTIVPAVNQWSPSAAVTGPSSSIWTLSTPPTSTNITADVATSTWTDSAIVFTNTAGFAAGGMQSLRYVFDQLTTHTWNDAETQWTAGTLTVTATAHGSWYLHVKGYNGASVGNGTADLGPYFIDLTVPTASGNLSLSSKTDTTLTLTLGAAATDVNTGIKEYKIFRSTTSPVTESGTLVTTIATASYTAGNTVLDSGPLTAGTTYYYNIWAYDNATNKTSATQLTAATTNVPTVAASVGNEPKSEGAVTPVTSVRDKTPEFSAVFSDADAGDTATKYQIQVNTNNTFTGTVMWDSTQVTFGTPLANNTRMADVSYAGTTLDWGTPYYWKIRFSDQNGVWSAYSAAQQFTMYNILYNAPSTTWSFGASPRPFLEYLMRHGGYFQGGVEKPYWLTE